MNAITTTARALTIALAAVALVGNTGCTRMMKKPAKMLSLDSTWPFRDDNEPQEGTPTRMTCTWTDTVMSTPGKKSQRGFGGRIMFYEKDEKKPILVEGQLVVYAFDEADREPTDNKPTRRYVFPKDQIPLHMSKNEFGASYSFFLPWDEAGGPEADIGLICRFEPVDAPIVTSEQTKTKLPGTMAPVAADGKKKPPKLPEGVPSKPAIETLQSLQAKRTDERRAQQASYEAPVSADGQVVNAGGTADPNLLPAKKMSSTTINLPGSFQMPNAAAFTNQNAPAVNSVQPAMQTAPQQQQALQPQQQQQYNQPSAQQSPAPQSSATNAMPSRDIRTTVQQQVGLSRSFQGIQPTAPSSAIAPPVMFGQSPVAPSPNATVNTSVQTSPMPPDSRALPAQNSPALLQTPPNFAASPNAQPLTGQVQAQLAMQLAAMQQQQAQQQMAQQQVTQQRMLQQQMPPQQTAGNAPAVLGGTATVSYPTVGQYLR